MGEASATSVEVSLTPVSILSAHDAAGIALGRYRLDKQIGQGGMGQVFEGWDLLLQRQVAIKRVQFSAPGAQGWLEEARCIAALSHTGFVAIHEAWTDGPNGYLVMERVQGITLAERIDRGALSLDEVRQILLQAAQALSHAHAVGIIHGDLKPSNLMLQEDGRLRILDLGLARRLDPLVTGAATDSPAGGTLAYMAPELLLGEPPSQASDVYALALVAHALLEGRQGPGDLPALQLAHARIHQPPPLRSPGDEGALQGLLAQMLHRDPQLRPSMAAVALQSGGAGHLIAGAAPKISKPRRARSSWALAGALCVMLTSSTLVGERTVDTPARFGSALFRAEDFIRHYDDPGALDEASRLLERELAAQPGHAAALALLSLTQCLRYAGDQRDDSWLQRAAGNADAALSADDHLALAWTATAWVLEFRRKYDDAERHFRRALLLEPQNLFAMQGLARLLERVQRRDEAKQLLQDAIAAFPGDRSLLDALGALLFASGDNAGAEQMFRRSIAAKPTGVYAYANLSAVLLHEGRSKEGLTVLQQGLRLHPHSWLYNNLGNILYAEGRYAEAADAFERGLSAEKGNPNDPVKWANLADTLRWVPGRETDARSAYRRALQLLDVDKAGQDATTLSRAGLYAARLNDPRWLAWTEQAVAKAPDRNEVRFRAALAFEYSGQRKRALEQLRVAMIKGYPRQLVESEPELLQLRRDRRYHELMSQG